MIPDTVGTMMFKLVLIGDGAVGKTSIRRKYLGKGFISSHIATIGVDFAQKYVTVDNTTCRLVIWDLAGQTGYERVRKHYYQGCSGLILVYDVTCRESFDNASRWLVEAFTHAGEIPPTAILANKIDLRTSKERSKFVQPEEGQAFASIFRAKLEVPAVFFETSAKNGENIEESFSTLAHMMIAEEEKQKGKKK
ncbi:MAG: GTP-binding protein [Candidatus Thorarchaeota archaeon]|nr:MAG: GTP-binding protein [Candidatus Thorarchaeota archaeon]